MKVIQYPSDDIKIIELIKKDPKLKPLFEKTALVTLTLYDDYFKSLMEMIISQQLSGVVAEKITNRVHTFFKNEVTPEKVMNADDEALRECGLSYRKISYLKSLAQKVHLNEIDLKKIDTLSNEEITNQLVKVKGIGPWTAQMFLMFSLGRENVFSVLDLGLRTNLQKLYGQSLTDAEMVEVSKQWDPYQSIVSHYLWRYK